MSEATTTSGNSGKTLFLQLRHLAAEVDTGIRHLQQEVDINKCRSSDLSQQAQAINFLLHTRKEMADLRGQVQREAADFSRRNTTINRINELMRNFLVMQAERLECVEAHMEKYGYKRPSFALDNKCEVTENDQCTAYQTNTENEAEDKSSEEVDDSSDVDQDEEVKLKTPPPSETVSKVAELKFLRTPRLEDLYKDLSESTVMLFKYGSKAEGLTKLSGNNNNSVIFTPSSISSSSLGSKPRSQLSSEPASFKLSKMTNQFDKVALNGTRPITSIATPSTTELPKFLAHDREISTHSAMPSSHWDCHTGVGSTSKFENMSLVRSPESPTLLTPGLKLNKLAKATPDQKEVKSARSLFNTPPLPELKTCVLTGFDFSSYAIAYNKESNRIVNTSKVQEISIIKSPKSPTLLTPGLKLNNFAKADPDKKEGKSARCLFSTPPLPELKTCVLTGLDFSSYAATYDKENRTTENTKKVLISTPEPPKLLYQGMDFGKCAGYPVQTSKKN